MYFNSVLVRPEKVIIHSSDGKSHHRTVNFPFFLMPPKNAKTIELFLGIGNQVSFYLNFPAENK